MQGNKRKEDTKNQEKRAVAGIKPKVFTKSEPLGELGDKIFSQFEKLLLGGKSSSATRK